jgi:hypothetical protein
MSMARCEDVITILAEQKGVTLEDESTDTGDEFDVESASRSSDESDEGEALERTLESMGLVMRRPHVLSPIFEFNENEDGVDWTLVQNFYDSNHQFPVKVCAPSNLRQGRKEKFRASKEPLKKRPLYADCGALIHDELEPVTIPVSRFLLEDSFGDFLRNLAL